MPARDGRRGAPRPRGRFRSAQAASELVHLAALGQAHQHLTNHRCWKYWMRQNEDSRVWLWSSRPAVPRCANARSKIEALADYAAIVGSLLHEPRRKVLPDVRLRSNVLTSQDPTVPLWVAKEGARNPRR